MITDIKPSKLMWLDLEMTGLNPATDLILEIAVIITDYDFTEISRYISKVKNTRSQLQERLDGNVWWNDYPENKKLFLDQSSQGQSLAKIEQDVIELIDQIAADEVIFLAGNSIHSDRKFIARYWPALDQRLHYRMLDVSAFKILMNQKYQIEFSKVNNHRAILDVVDSINELKYYLNWFFKQ